MQKISEKIQKLIQDCANCKIMAVSKTQTTAAILAAHQAGIVDFGENYVQEAMPKIIELKPYALTWHYIGRMQTNKCKKIAQYFTWVHTIDNLEVAQKLEEANARLQQQQKVCIQVNLFAEPQKAGIAPPDLGNLVKAITKLKHLKLKGLMTILPDHLSASEQHQAYLRLADLMHEVNQYCTPALDTLSMGMSDDYPQAIAAGATIIRLGQAIFGPRKPLESI